MVRRVRDPAHLRWLAEVICASPAQQIVFQEYVRAVNEHHERLERIETELQEKAKGWRFYPVVEALQARRGVQFTVALSIVAELGDLSRFDSPRQLMSYLGLTPCEYDATRVPVPGDEWKKRSTREYSKVPTG